MTRLSELKKGQRARIHSIHRRTIAGSSPEKTKAERMTERLLEIGLVEGSEVEICHEAPFGKDPIAVKVRGALIGLRRNEAELVEVEIL